MSSFFTNAFIRDQVWRPCHNCSDTLVEDLSFRLTGRLLSRKISLYLPKMLHCAFFLIRTSCLVLFYIAIVCSRCLTSLLRSHLLVCCLLCKFVFVMDLVFPIYISILSPIFKLSSITDVPYLWHFLSSGLCCPQMLGLINLFIPLFQLTGHF